MAITEEIEEIYNMYAAAVEQPDPEQLQNVVDTFQKEMDCDRSYKLGSYP